MKEDDAWTRYRERFSEIYDNSNYLNSLQGAVMRSSHKLIEKPHDSGVYFGRVIEIGAGTGEHLAYIRHKFDEYILTDLDEKALNVAKKKLCKAGGGCLRFEVQGGVSLSYADNTFDRLVATHVLEHIYHPHLALKEWRRVLKPGGVLSVLIPTDPGIAWRLGRHLGPRRNAVSQGIPYDYVMAREHVNSCNNLIALLRHYFSGAEETWWPFPFSSIDLNLFFAFHAVINKEDDEK